MVTKISPILKMHWERRMAQFPLSPQMAKKLIEPYCHDKIEFITPMSNGCANANFKVECHQDQPLVIRIYLREPSALAREKSLYQYLYNIVPVPHILYSDDSCQLINHPYAITSYIDGQLMRDVILENKENNISECAYAAGKSLKKLRELTFSEGGFFSKDLSIKPFPKGDSYHHYVNACLDNKHVQSILNKPSVSDLKQIMKQFEADIPTKPFNLTHGDFDPSNMIVSSKNGHFELAGLLDWEFAFAGSYLLDMGSFLRYAHKLPSVYEKSFIEGIDPSGQMLPSHWKRSAKLMDLINLLSLLQTSASKERPNLTEDIKALIQHSILHIKGY